MKVTAPFSHFLDSFRNLAAPATVDAVRLVPFEPNGVAGGVGVGVGAGGTGRATTV